MAYKKSYRDGRRELLVCARPDCRLPFVVPGDRGVTNGHNRYCSDQCRYIMTSRIQRAAFSELARRHHDEFVALRAAMSERLHAPPANPG